MIERWHIDIEGIVQGVGFRPTVYRLALTHRLSGWVLNDSTGVQIEIEGETGILQQFSEQLQAELPPLAVISKLQSSRIPPKNESTFSIRHSEQQQQAAAQIAPDSDVCPDCLKELFDPQDRRYRYPFINCTNCGPRYSIITAIPYDRPNTTMASFAMCPACLGEYQDPTSRRFHAQPNACPACGPQLELLDHSGTIQTGDPLDGAISLLRQGNILAIKGVGGFHLAVNASNDAAVAELRRRKNRDEKPFALMDYNLERIATYAEIGPDEKKLLHSPERPIVLLRQRQGHRLSPLIAPRNNYFGVMLPGTPLHYLLLEQLPTLVMTSGNISDEPIAFEDGDARQRLASIADYILTHNRPIHIRCDDSIARVMADKPLLLRRSRGIVPRALKLPGQQENILALGAELKNSFCLTRRNQAFLSQHIGDLKNLGTLQSLRDGVEHLKQLLEWQPQAIACDLHPDYLSTAYANEQQELPIVQVQHHHAHLASCMAENGISTPCIGVIFDGIGYGTDGHIWGGEFLVGDLGSCQRTGHFAYLPLPGGDIASKQPWRMAISALLHCYGEEFPQLPFLATIPPAALKLVRQMIRQGINSPLTSSCGRLFDAVAALVGLRNEINYEGQAALELEMAVPRHTEFQPYPYTIQCERERLIFNPATTLMAIVSDLQAQIPVGCISGRFHAALAHMLCDICQRIRRQQGINRVVLSGGVFQNRLLTELAVSLLRQGEFEVFTHSLVPPNDGGIALGQAVVAGHLSRAGGAFPVRE